MASSTTGQGAGFLRNTNVLILTDDAEFARLLTGCWQAEGQLPGICVVTSEFWREADTSSPDLIVVGPLKDGKLGDVLRSMEPNTALILCAPSEARELGLLRKKYPKLLHVPLREDWTQVVLLLAGESLRRTQALKLARHAGAPASPEPDPATPGRHTYHIKHNTNNPPN